MVWEVKIFRIIFIRDRIDWGDGHGEKGFIFDPSSRKKKPFDFCGYKIWSNVLHIFVTIQGNIFSTLEILLHEITHLVIHFVFLRGKIAEKVNWWYEFVYWKLLRLLSKI